MTMTLQQFENLCRDDVRQAIDENLDRDPVAVALDRRVPCAAEVATQVKYLQRARRKLPSYHTARCIVPPLAFEQSSGEECARRKAMSGGSLLDLTCGLGVDAAAMASKFSRVVAVERDEVLARVARENMRRLGIGNVEVVCDSAEHFVAECRERFDWCFADPDRRGADGSKRVVLEDCSPDIRALLPRLRELAPRLCLKMSPMFDVDEAFRIFGRCGVEAVSMGGECKEVLVYADDREPTIGAAAVGRESWTVEVSVAAPPAAREFDPAAYGWLAVPDVALRKARLTRRYFAERLPDAFVPGDNGFAFCPSRPAEEGLFRLLEIERIERYEPRRLRREMKGRRPEMLLRDVPLTVAQIEWATGMRNGGEGRMAFTTVGGEIWVIGLK